MAFVQKTEINKLNNLEKCA